LDDWNLEQLVEALKEKGFIARRTPINMSGEPDATTTFGGHTFALYKTPNYNFDVKEFASQKEHDGVKGRVVTLTCPELSVVLPLLF
jgi:hypothetical protein